MSLGVLCPGQGAQHAKMLDLIAGDAAAETVLRFAAATLRTDARALLAGPPERLFINTVAQPLICAAAMATWAALAPRLPAPRVFAGYSVGELAAYGCAGALAPASVMEVASARAEAMDGAGMQPCWMCAVRGLTRAALEPLADRLRVHIAIVNGDDRFVVAGPVAHMETFEAAALEQGARLNRLPIQTASHTPRMAPAALAVRRRLEMSALATPLVPVLAGVDGTPVLSRARAIDTLSRQIAQTVDWAACMEGLREAGCRSVLELGPGSDLTRMVRDRFPDMPARSVEEFRSLEGIIGWVNKTLAG